MSSSQTSSDTGRSIHEGLFSPVSLSISVKTYMGASAAVRTLGLVRTVLLAWLLVRAEFGKYQLGLLLANVLLPIASLGLHEGLLRFVPEHESGRLGRFLVGAVGRGLLVSVAICVLVLAAAPWLAPVLLGAMKVIGADASAAPLADADGTGLLRSVCVVAAALTAYHLVLAVLRARRMFRAAGTMELCMAAVFTILAVGAAACGVDHGRSVLHLYALSAAVLTAGFAATMPWRGEAQPVPPTGGPVPGGFANLLRYSIGAGAAALSWQLLMSYAALHLQRVAGPETFAVFDLMRSWTQVGLLASAALAAPLASAVTREWTRASPEAALGLLDLAHKAVAAGMLMGSLLLALAREAIGLLLPVSYRAGLIAAGVLLSAFFAAATAQLLVIRLTLIKRSELILGCWLVGCATAALLSHLLIGPGDADQAVRGAAWSTLAGVLAALVCVLACLRRHGLLSDRGLLRLAACCGLLLLPGPLLAAALVGVPLCACGTTLLFSRQQRTRLAGWLRSALPVVFRV